MKLPLCDNVLNANLYKHYFNDSTECRKQQNVGYKQGQNVEHLERESLSCNTCIVLSLIDTRPVQIKQCLIVVAVVLVVAAAL